jgi:hypothetical protein
MSYPDKVKKILWDDIHMLSQTPELFSKKPERDFTRKRKLEFENLLKFQITMQTEATNDELLKFFNYSTQTASGSALSQQKDKLLPSVFSSLLTQFNSHFPCKTYENMYRLLGVDGCDFNIYLNPNDPDTYHSPSDKSKRGFNSLQIVALYDLLNRSYIDCTIQPGRKKNEFRAICDLSDRYIHLHNEIPVFIGDRGFACYNFYAHAKEKNIGFLVRYKDISVKRLLGLQELPDFMDTAVDIILTRTASKKKRTRPELAERYRQVSADVAFDYIEKGSYDEYDISLRIVRIEVADGVFENLITNLFDVPYETLKQWYSMRWGIETSFRELKHAIGATKFHSKKYDFIVLEIWARLVLYNFCSVITEHVIIKKKGKKHMHQVNYSRAIKICIKFIRLKEHEKPPDVIALISKHTLPVRLGRSFVRRHRFQSVASFCYR